jgi:glycerol uptake facilitator-like aquaporin
MNVKRLAIGSIVGAIILYVLGILFWEYLFADFFQANGGGAVGVTRPEMIMWALIVGTLLYGVLLTLTLEWRGSKSVVGGLITGAIVGALLWGTGDFTHYAINTMNNLAATIADTALEGVRGGVTGAIVAFVLSKVGD